MAFFSQFLAYLESGFPLFVELESEEHAVVVVGHNWKQVAASPPAAASHVWTQVETLMAIDDNLLPYAAVPLASHGATSGSPTYTADSVTSFIVALPEKIYYPADAVAVLSGTVKRAFEVARGPDKEPLELQRYFITTIASLRKHARDQQTFLGDELVGLIMRLETAQFVWIIEYGSVAQWNEEKVAARAIVDATASPRDPVPYWVLHDEEVAHVFDRTSPETNPTKSIQLEPRRRTSTTHRIESAPGRPLPNRHRRQRGNPDTWRRSVNRRLEDYLRKRPAATVDQEMFDELRREMKKAVPEIAESIKERVALAAELRIAASKPSRSRKREKD